MRGAWAEFSSFLEPDQLGPTSPSPSQVLPQARPRRRQAAPPSEASLPRILICLPEWRPAETRPDLLVSALSLASISSVSSLYLLRCDR
jgi:hypothetical protein